MKRDFEIKYKFRSALTGKDEIEKITIHPEELEFIQLDLNSDDIEVSLYQNTNSSLSRNVLPFYKAISL